MRSTSSATRSTGKVLAVALATSLIATACGGGGGGAESEESGGGTTTSTAGNGVIDEGTPIEGGNLIIAVESETPGWNPATNTWTLEGNFIGSSFLEPLMVYNSKNEAVPWLAESVVPNENATEWTITVRQGITFQDGAELDAQAVADSLIMQNSPEALASIVTAELIGAPTVTGKYTLTIPVNVQWGSFDTYLATGFGYVMAPSMLADTDYGTNRPVGTGAYSFEKNERDRYLRVRRFDGYWGGPCARPEPSERVVTLCEDMGVELGQRNGPYLDSMEFRPIPDSVQRQQALEAGDVDLILNTRPGITAGLRSNFEVVTDYTSEQNFVQLQTGQAPFDNKHARRALAYATDRVALVEALGAGEDIPVDTSPFEEADVWGGLAPDETNYPLYDPGKAAEELELYLQDMADAGTPVDKLSFDLLGVASLDDLELMQALSAMWAKAGIETSIESIKKESLVIRQVTGDFQAVVSRNYAWADPDGNYIFWATDFLEGDIKLNFNQFATEKTQAALQLGRESQDPVFRKKAYDELVRERNDNAVDIWLFNTPWAMIGEKNIRGLNAFRNLGIAGYYAKPWVSGLWIDPAG